MIEKSICEVAGCDNESSRITATESKYIEICNDCWNKKYKS